MAKDVMFATISDYTARYGAPGDLARANLLLKDASDLALSAFEDVFGEYAEGVCATFDRNVCAVCCLVVNRVLLAPAALAGATQYSQGAGGYTSSVVYGQALGEMYLGKSELKRLGLLTQRLGALSPVDHTQEQA
jgi:hypothetical protein